MCCQPDRQATQPNWPARQRVSRTATLSQRSQPNWTNPAFWTAQSFCLRHQVAVASASRECAKLLQVSSAAQPCGTSKAARQRSPAGRLTGVREVSSYDISRPASQLNQLNQLGPAPLDQRSRSSPASQPTQASQPCGTSEAARQPQEPASAASPTGLAQPFGKRKVSSYDMRSQ